MAEYVYTARNQDGQKVEGSLSAGDRRSAVQQIERMGYTPVRVTDGNKPAPPSKSSAKEKAPATSKAKATTPGRERQEKKAKPKSKVKNSEREASLKWSLLGHRSMRMKLREVLLFTQELSDLLSSGMTLGKALNTLSSRESSKAQGVILKDLRDNIQQGASLSEALAHHPGTFSPLYSSMVRAGEASGTLPGVLERLCFHYERVQEAREKVLMAMVYPAIIMVVGAGTLVFSMIFVIPRFTAIFEELGSELPAATKLMASMSTFLIHYWWALLLAIAGGSVLFKKLTQTEKGLRVWHGLQLRIPLVNQIITTNAFSHFARTLGALLTNGVPVLNAMSIVEDTVGNRVITDEIRAARERVTDGSTISGPLAEGKVFPRLLTDMLAVGEESGNMSGALGHIANRYDRELDRTVKIFTTVLEPVMILVMAVLVGFIAISMLTAVFDMTSGLNP